MDDEGDMAPEHSQLVDTGTGSNIQIGEHNVITDGATAADMPLVKECSQLPNPSLNTPQNDPRHLKICLMGSNTNLQFGNFNKIVKCSTAPQSSAGRGSETVYKMTSDPRGLCLIFNNKEFEGKTERLGSDKDRDELDRVFTKLKFKVEVSDNSAAEDMRDKLKEVSQMNHSEYDCLVVVFLTHGREGVVKGSDNEWLKVDSFVQSFKSFSCPTLVDKPKLFFFQSCRGTKYQRGDKVAHDDGDDGSGGESAGTEVEKLVAPEADFFFGYATTPGTKSLRNEETGSWYIQALTRTLDEDADREDLLSMMTTVKRRVNSRKSETYDGGFLKQTAEMTSRLLRKLFF